MSGAPWRRGMGSSHAARRRIARRDHGVDLRSGGAADNVIRHGIRPW